jgi:vacuolar-type H+-ATPase subunit F/Vma7
MSRVLAIGERALVEGYALAGAEVREAETEAEIRRAWDAVPPDTGLVILTASAAAVLRPALRRRPRVLWAVLPP